MKRIIKIVAGLIGILYIKGVHTFYKNDGIIVLPDGIGEIVNSCMYWDSTFDDHRKIILICNNSRSSVLDLIEHADCKCIIVPDWIHKCNKSVIFSRIGKKFLKKNRSWVVLPIKDPTDIQFGKGFIWNIKDSMGAKYCDTWRLKNELDNSSNNSTIYLNPFARTVNNLQSDFFEILAQRLTEKGYSVKTVLGSNRQKPINGTEGVLCELKEAIDLVNDSSGLIGLRSGFMDLMASQAKCRVVCVYPSNYPYIDFFSFKNLEYPNSVNEVIVDVNSEVVLEVSNVVKGF